VREYDQDDGDRAQTLDVRPKGLTRRRIARHGARLQASCARLIDYGHGFDATSTATAIGASSNLDVRRNP
jgi:hypothetical protein